MRTARPHRIVLRCAAIVTVTAAAVLLVSGADAAQCPTGIRAHLYPAGTVVRLHQHVVRVSITNFAFKPARLVVSPGTRIVWTNQDPDPHTVTSARGIWASDALDTDNRFTRVFAAAGTFAYYCAIHPFMRGTIIVVKR